MCGARIGPEGLDRNRQNRPLCLCKIIISSKDVFRFVIGVYFLFCYYYSFQPYFLVKDCCIHIVRIEFLLQPFPVCDLHGLVADEKTCQFPNKTLQTHLEINRSLFPRRIYGI